MELTKETILKAWKDESYLASLPEDVRNAIPARPTAPGGKELSDAELEEAAGGTITVGLAAAGIVAGAGIVGIGGGEGIHDLTK